MRALVIGGGIGGLCTARALAQAGVEATVFERADELEQIQVGGAIHLWQNGMRGLKRLGFSDRIEQLAGRAAAVDRAEMRSWRGRLITSWSVAESERELGVPTVGIVRPDLHRVLAEGAGDGILRLGRRCVGFRPGAGDVAALFADGTEERGDVLIGADGIHSATRAQLLGDEPPRFAKYASWQALAAYRDEAAPVGLFRIVWGPGARFLFYRVSEEQVYWEGIFATRQGGDDPPGGRKQAVLERFGTWDRPVGEIVGATAEAAISRTDCFDRPPVKRWGEGPVTLLGDAAHAMTNAAGQGANQTIEDAVVLGLCLRGSADPAGALRTYEQRRMGRTAAVSNLAWNLSRLSRLSNPVACVVRDNLLKLVLGTVGKRAQRKDMAYEF